jgi:hypothetical protein
LVNCMLRLKWGEELARRGKGAREWGVGAASALRLYTRTPPPHAAAAQTDPATASRREFARRGRGCLHAAARASSRRFRRARTTSPRLENRP